MNSSDQKENAPILKMVNTGNGNILLHGNSISLLDQIYISFNQFAIAVASSDLYIGDLDENKKEILGQIEQLSEQGFDLSEIDVDLQVRYTRVLEDLISEMISGVTDRVAHGYKNQRKIIY